MITYQLFTDSLLFIMKTNVRFSPLCDAGMIPLSICQSNKDLTQIMPL